jgi:hypothetical protein
MKQMFSLRLPRREQAPRVAAPSALHWGGGGGYSNQSTENIQKSVHLHCADTPKDWQLKKTFFEKLVSTELKS